MGNKAKQSSISPPISFGACDGEACVGEHISGAATGRDAAARVFFGISTGRNEATQGARRCSDRKFDAFQFVYLWPLN